MAVYRDANEKRRAYHAACAAGRTAWDFHGREYSLRDVKIDDVEYIAGAWRVQNKFTDTIQLVRGKEFVLCERLDRAEKNLFEFYRALVVGVNCYGRFVHPALSRIVAKYETDDETLWAYGATIEQARAFLGISLYDKYMNLIHAHACKNKIKGLQK